MAKKKKGNKVSVRKPQLRVNKNGVHLGAPSARIGNRRAGFNISRSGLSFSVRTPFGMLNTRRGCTKTLPLLLGALLLPVFVVLAGVRLISQI